jgi:hypothetical protein
MSMRKPLIPLLLIINLMMSACIYIVLPEGLETTKSNNSKGWSAVVTNVSQTEAGDLHIDLTIRNETTEWSTMKAVEGQPAVLTIGDGKSHACETVFVGTGGHRLAPGFQMRGYTAGTKAEPQVQLIYVECKGVQASAGSKLTIDYIAFSGELNYYHQEEGESKGTLELKLDQVVTDLNYPIFEPVEGLIQEPGVGIPALSDCVITLLDVLRTEEGFDFTWQNYNPSEFALKIHIGNPPVIGEDGIIYGYYEIMDLTSTPITPPGGTTEWVTKAVVPKDVKGFYILLSVESKNMRLYVNYAIDITDQ